MNPRLEIWMHYTRLPDDRNKAKCNYCSRMLLCDPQKNGTSSLISHAKSCKKHPDRSNNQTQLCFQPSEDGQSGCVVPWQYNAEEVRAAFTRMIIIDELPFIFSEHEGFRDFMSKACPRFSAPSSTTMYRDVLRLYEAEKAKLKKFFKDTHQTVSLTTDTWTSSTLQNYMVLTAHYIDINWQLNKKILNFCLVDSHKGEDIGKALDKCLLEWGIDNVCTITVDNASSNDTAINYMRSALKNRGGTFAKGCHLHMRCVAHIINLVVQDGLKTVAPSITRIRNAIKYVRSSTARMNSFKRCVQISKVEEKGLVSLDVCTRWNSTYLMLDTVVGFEKAFERLELQDPSYKAELGVDGIPKYDDWVYAKDFKEFLKHFFDLTKKVSGTQYVTSNTFFEDIAGVNYLLCEWTERQDDDDNTFKDMAVRMKAKFDKYWGDPEKMNNLIFIAAILDPRTKQSGFFQRQINKTFGTIKGDKIWEKVQKSLLDLFCEYKNAYSQVGCQGTSATEQTTSSNEPSSIASTNIMRSLYNKRMKVTSGGGGKSELDKYLAEDTEDDDIKDFDILSWWKCNSPRFPILSRMARDILAIPISTVAFESAFSTSGRVLDDFRSSLTPLTLQCLICAQDWLRRSKRINIEANLRDLTKFEEGIEMERQVDDVITTSSVFSSDRA